MSNILSPRPESALNSNHDIPTSRSRSTSPVKQKPCFDSSVQLPRESSSPFQTEVDQENRPPHDFSSSPLARKSPSKSSTATKPFAIHEDTQPSDPTITSHFLQHIDDEVDMINSTQMEQGNSQDFTDNMNVAAKDSDFFTLSQQKPQSMSHDEADAQSVMSDDTCFSNFSAVPNADMTMFAKLGNNRNTTRDIDMTPSHSIFQTPRTSRKELHRSPSKSRYESSEETTSLLLDFTGQFSKSSLRNGSPTKSATEPNLLSFINGQRRPSPKKSDSLRTPAAKNRQSILNLLDFELPPAPTPRSIPTITVRELESLKSQYLSEISSLKATLSGREVEVSSLKTAVADAERRCGQALEEAREEKSMREHAEQEKSEWVKKGEELESLLQDLKADFLASAKEQEELSLKLDEAVQARQESEAKLAEASTDANNKAINLDASTGAGAADVNVDELVQTKVAQQLDEKMENLARELHAVYKKKHESKVAKLKETYEMKSEKKNAELQRKIEELTKSYSDLNDSYKSLRRTSSTTIKSADHEQVVADLQAQKAKTAGLAEEIASIRQDQAQLLSELERERVEKGELVAAVDEMLSLQSEVGAPSAIEDFRRSISSRPTAPGMTKSSDTSRLTKPSGGLPTKGSSLPGKSRMMSNIERMGGGNRV